MPAPQRRTRSRDPSPVRTAPSGYRRSMSASTTSAYREQWAEELLDRLTPVILRSDTAVTNHGFRNGSAKLNA